MKPGRKLFWAVAVTAVLVGGAAGAVAFFAGKSAGKAGWGADEAVSVRAEKVVRGDLVEVVSAPGQTEPRTRVQISARIAARIIDLPLKEGERARKGEGDKPGSVLVRLDASDLEANLKATEARFAAQKAGLAVAQVRLKSRALDLEAAQVLLEDAERDLARQEGLLKTGDVSQVTVDAARVRAEQQQNQMASLKRSLEADESNLEVLRYGIQAGEAEIAQAKEQLSYAVIHSPIDGTVTRVNAKEGELVVTGTMNNAGTVILEVADLSRMLVIARVDESAIAQVRTGQRATARSTAYPGKVFTGVVQTVALSKTTPSQASARGEPSDGQPHFKVEVLLDEGQEVLAGISADVEIEVRTHTKAVKVPSQAIMGKPVDELPSEALSRGDVTVDRARSIATVVYVIKPDNTADVRPVRMGASDLTHTIIDAGVAEGETVVTGPYKALEAMTQGRKVKLDTPASPATQSTRPATSPAK